MTATGQARRALGRWGEDLATRFLLTAGLAVLERNWRCELGEVDIVARDADDLVVVEVKTRTGEEFGTPLEAVCPRKAARLRRLAARWLQEHPVSPREVRIDVVSVVVPSRGRPQVEHIRGVC